MVDFFRVEKINIFTEYVYGGDKPIYEKKNSRRKNIRGCDPTATKCCNGKTL
jgi:hypothetical protein